MALIGYARVSTDEQTTDPQIDALRAAGCQTILREHGSGGDRARPKLKRAIERCSRSDVLVVVRIDHLARSLSHLLEIIEMLDARGAGFESIKNRGMSGEAWGAFAEIRSHGDRSITGSTPKPGLDCPTTNISSTICLRQ
jgi:DNA invertase Pin-like site-specific DNA recombinase